MTIEKKKNSLWKRLVRYFVAGAFMMLPLVLTVVAISWGIGFLSGLVGPDTFLGDLLSRVGLRFVTDPTVAYVLGWVGFAALVFVVGFLVESGMRGFISRVTDAVLRRVPLVGKVYETSQQFVNMIDTGGDDKLKGMSVAYCSFGKRGGVGVLALLPKQDIININGDDYYVVLVPQSPVPIGGGLLFMPVDSVQQVDMTVDTLMSIYVSMGVVVPGSLPDTEAKRPDHDAPNGEIVA